MQLNLAQKVSSQNFFCRNITCVATIQKDAQIASFSLLLGPLPALQDNFTLVMGIFWDR